jgi:redox-sensitive bicupin YhaK (pirin superfamily)
MIDLVISQRRKDLGGFEVGRVLPFAQRRMVGPFIFFDHLGPAILPAGIPKTMDVRPHPHIGLSTVTYLFEGEIMHRDSVGSEQAILPGEMNWMIAGSGITHSERFEHARAEGGALHGIQAWVALPEEFEETAPAFFHHDLGDLPTFDAKGVAGRVIAGEVFGLKAKVKVHSPIFYAHVAMQPGAVTELAADYSERAAYVAMGGVEIDGQKISAGNMAVFAPGQAVKIKAETAATVMLLGGEPMGPRFIDWNFVSSSKDRIEQAKADWKAQRMKLPDLDDKEFTPLPEPRT